MVEVKQSNPRAFDQLDVKLKELDGYTSKVGFFDTAKYEDGTPVAQVAFWQENGVASRSIPPRPVWGPGFKKFSASWKDAAGLFAKRVLDGQMTGREAMTALGETAQGDIIKQYAELKSPPLSRLTLAIRKYKLMHPDAKIGGKLIGMIARMLKEGKIDTSGVSDKPLNDSGYMIASLTNKTESTR